MKTLIGDAGHGGKDSGAVSLDGSILEKDITLIVTNRASDLLKPYLRVYLTRAEDVFLTLKERAKAANQLSADVFSIHCNAGGGHGFEVFTSEGQTRSDGWATDVLEELSAEFPDRRARSDYDDGDADKEANFAILRRTTGAAILIELGFIDTEEGAQFLNDPENQERLAQAIARGTLKNRGITFVSDPDSQPTGVLTTEERLTALEEAVAILGRPVH